MPSCVKAERLKKLSRRQGETSEPEKKPSNFYAIRECTEIKSCDYHDLSGFNHSKVSGSGPGFEAGTDTKITFVRFIKLSGYHELNDRWALLGTVGWEDWSAFKNVNISTSRGSQKIPRNWDDTCKFSAGVHFRPVNKWLLQLGVAYDTSPVDSDDRTPDMPIDRQIRYATGVQYKWSDKLSTGAQFVYADYGKAKIDNDLLKGDYKRNDLFFFALNANWKF